MRPAHRSAGGFLGLPEQFGHSVEVNEVRLLRSIGNAGAAVVAASLALGATAGQPAQTPGSNVNVTTCHAQLDPPPLRIAYINAATATAVEIDFDIVTDVGTIESVADRGQFSPGQPINHVFKLPEGASPLGLSSAQCVVTKVVYADGTTWSKPHQ
jgi:hypothetical protein